MYTPGGIVLPSITVEVACIIKGENGGAVPDAVISSFVLQTTVGINCVK